jgi:hypothetical protein
VNGETESITVGDLHAVGERHEVPGYKCVVREVMATVDRWPEFADQAELDAATREAVNADLMRFRPT